MQLRSVMQSSCGVIHRSAGRGRCCTAAGGVTDSDHYFKTSLCVKNYNFNPSFCNFTGLQCGCKICVDVCCWRRSLEEDFSF